MTAPNPDGVRRCVRGALADARVEAGDVDVINGHLTATGADPREIESWAAALARRPESMPKITATKSMIGHALGAAGGIESVACVLMIENGFVHPSINCEDLHESIEPFGAAVAREAVEMPDMRVLVKAGFGFGDVNACVVFGAWRSGH